MKYRQLSIFVVILLMLQQVNVVLCDSQFPFSKNGVVKSQIDLDCFGNHSGVITTDIYKYIFPSGSDISKLGMLYFPNNYQNENSGNDFIFLEFFNKDIGFTCLPFNKSIPSMVYDHKLFAKRTKRNSNSSNAIYFNQRVLLRCFDDQPNHPNNQIESFKWDFSDGKSLSDVDYYDEQDKYGLGEKTGDIVLKNYTGKAVNVSCMAVIDGKVSVGHSYQLIPVALPEPPFIEFNEKRLFANFDGKVGCYNFTCKSLGGRPDPELSLSLNGIQLMSLNNSNIHRTICVDDTDNGASLICISTHIGNGELWKKEEKININVIASDGLSGGIIAAIVISLLVFVVVVAVVIAYYLRKKHASHKAREYATGEAELG